MMFECRDDNGICVTLFGLTVGTGLTILVIMMAINYVVNGSLI
jgi:hypothetical protein